MPRHPVRTIAALFVGLPLLLLAASSARAQHTPTPSLKQANKHMAEVVTGYEATFYGGCADANTTVHHAIDGDPPSKTGKRAERLEAVNRWRSNAAIVVTPGKQRPCGACDLEIANRRSDKKSRPCLGPALSVMLSLSSFVCSTPSRTRSVWVEV